METELRGQALVDDVVNELRAIVREIEALPATTENHYDKYMSILSKYPMPVRRTVAMLLIKAGANENGVTWAYKLSKGGNY